MRFACRSVALFLLFSCPLLVKAVTIRTQDPSYTNITYTPSTFSFGSCSGILDAGVQVSGDGCFVAENETKSSISSITLTFQDTSVIDASGPNLATSDIFLDDNALCAGGSCSFTYNNGSLGDNAFLFIIETGVTDPSQFPVVTFAYTTSATPEPGSALLLATGLMCMGGLYFQRRRA